MNNKATKPSPKAARDAAEHKLATVRLEAETRAMEKTLALLESPQPVPVPWNEYPQYDTWGMPGVTSRAMPYIWTNPDDRTEGRYRPFYENAHDVRRMRAQVRSIGNLFPVSRGALQKLSDYIIGNGWDFTAQPRKRYKNDPTAILLAKVIQPCIDKFLEYNNFVGRMDREIHEESRVDGDSFPTLYPEDNCVRVELTDPACINEPLDKRQLENYLRTHGKLNGWWHGVHTVFNRALKRDDVSRPLGYHAVFDRLGDDWDYLPVSRVEHIKRNVGTGARVGVSDMFFVESDLQAEAKIRRNTAEGAAILAAIIMIREHAEGVSKSQIESMVSANSTTSYEKVVKDGTRTTYGEHIKAGTIKDMPHGMRAMLGPMGTLNQPIYIQVSQYVLRILASIWSMPEFMISGDSSNNNYASILVAESPFVKYCEDEQGFYAGHYERLIWKALRMMRDLGHFAGYNWQQVCTLLEINAEYTSPASRDRNQQANANAILLDKGILSKRGFASDMGLDYDEEQANMATEPKPEPPVIVQPNGLPQNPFNYGAGQRSSARTEGLALRAMDTLLESHGLREEKEKWVTIRGNPVQIDDDGQILTGPLKGKELGGGGDGETKTGKGRQTAIDATLKPSEGAGKAIAPDHDKYLASLSGAEAKAVKDYVTTGYERMNKTLRKGGEPTAKILAMDRAIDAAPGLKQSVVVARGVSNGDFLAKLKAGDVFRDNGFMSTEVGEQMANAFASLNPKSSSSPTIMHISVPKGSKGLFYGPGQQDEFILPRGSRLRITGVGEKKIAGGKRSVRLLQAELLSK